MPIPASVTEEARVWASMTDECASSRHPGPTCWMRVLHPMKRSFTPLFAILLSGALASSPAADATLTPPPAPAGVPAPGPKTDAPYAPQTVLPIQFSRGCYYKDCAFCAPSSSVPRETLS